jgi:hypothetical protein
MIRARPPRRAAPDLLITSVVFGGRLYAPKSARKSMHQPRGGFRLTTTQHMPTCRVRVCARECASAHVGVVACVVCSVLV